MPSFLWLLKRELFCIVFYSFKWTEFRTYQGVYQVYDLFILSLFSFNFTFTPLYVSGNLFDVLLVLVDVFWRDLSDKENKPKIWGTQNAKSNWISMTVIPSNITVQCITELVCPILILLMAASKLYISNAHSYVYSPAVLLISGNSPWNRKGERRCRSPLQCICKRDNEQLSLF